jgi:pyridinium-3,5-bisthiocarboxylic acid mononucleotide nickel chelatase
MRVAYFDCFSGASGDMILGALLDAGADLDSLRERLAGLHLRDEYALSSEPAQQLGITGTKARVRLLDDHGHHHRHLADILQIINAGSIADPVKDKSSAIFARLGRAEATVHGVDIKEIHFHEVGAVDAIVDIVGSVLALDLLGIEKVYSSPLPLGSGFVDCEHGRIPVPAPATLQLIKDVQAPVGDLEVDSEVLTPTGAAIITTLAEFRRPLMNVQAVGYGYGDKEFSWPNALRVWVGEEAPGVPASEKETADQMALLETNIDDMNPEIYGYLMERLFEKGAVDVYYTPIFMKKNRPAVMVSVLAPPDKEEEISALLMSETTTLGVRHIRVGRHKSEREEMSIDTCLGRARVKIKRQGDQIVNIAPEYEDCAAIARSRNLPLATVYRTVQEEAAKAVRGLL